MAAKVEAKVSHRFGATAEQVYDAWLDPDQARLWMAESACESRPRWGHEAR